MLPKKSFPTLKSLFARLAADENGGETVEWILVVGVIAVLCIVALREFGTTLADRWNAAMALL